jgi:quinol monooxygenase YgiN
MSSVRTAVTISLDRSDLEEVVGIFQTFIKDVQEKDYGVLTYHYYVDDDPLLIHVFEEYESSQAHLDHFANIDQQAVGRLLELVTLSAPHYYGDPSPEERELLSGFGTVHYHRPLLSIEPSPAQT